MTPVNLRRLDCTTAGNGPWQTVPDVPNRAIKIQHKQNRFTHLVYYGTRAQRTQEGAETQAVALGAILNAVKAKRP